VKSQCEANLQFQKSRDSIYDGEANHPVWFVDIQLVRRYYGLGGFCTSWIRSII
jgi:hypothetical protein